MPRPCSSPPPFLAPMSARFTARLAQFIHVFSSSVSASRPAPLLNYDTPCAAAGGGTSCAQLCNGGFIVPLRRLGLLSAPINTAPPPRGTTACSSELRKCLLKVQSFSVKSCDL
uniref:Uncharacterized protein n=1 Tax=Arundo donax TaxID=35708 RepID=A0A0A9CMB0_ARUDO